MGWNPFRDRRERRLAALEAWRTARRLADEDVTVFGEELARLHEETLATSTGAGGGALPPRPGGRPAGRCRAAHAPRPLLFNPQHGPAVADVPWRPPGGVERLVPVCRRDRERLEGGQEPDVRRFRVGDRWVSWWEAASVGGDARTAAVASYAGTAYGAHLNAHLMQAEARRWDGMSGGFGI